MKKVLRLNTRPARLFVALSMTLALAACQKLGNVAAGAGNKAPDIAVGASATGEITSSSPLNHNDGSRHQDYRITLKNGEAVSLELGGSLNGQLAVFDGSNMIAKANTGYYGMEDEGEAAPGPVSLAFRAPKDGTYLIAVNSVGADSFGPFKLKATQVVPYDGKPLAAGSQATDWLVGDKQEYKLKIDKAGLYSIVMESNAFDAYLRLTGRNVEQEDDDNGGNLNSRIRAWLEPGDYTLTTSSVNGSSGSFKLSINLTPTNSNLATRDGTALAIGQTAQGMIDSRGRRSFVLNLDNARRIQFDASADDFDATLRVTGPGVDAQDDDGGGGLNARLSLPLGPGRYTVEVSSLGNTQGMFELETIDLGGNVSTPANDNRKGDEAQADAAIEAE